MLLSIANIQKQWRDFYSTLVLAIVVLSCIVLMSFLVVVIIVGIIAGLITVFLAWSVENLDKIRKKFS
jgi:uncharacterized protein involved in cysteine biosynthesis